MRHLYILLLLLSESVFSQEINLATDTIQIKELVIKEDFRKFKESKVRIKSECLNAETMAGTSEIVTLVENLPDGYLESVTLYMNEAHFNTYRKDRKKFKDTEFEVVLYQVKADNTPGKRVMRDEKYIKILKEHTGEVVVHFLDFNIKGQRKMFIGLRRTDGIPAGTEFYLDCLCTNSKNITLTRTGNNEGWASRVACPALKMEVNVLVSPE